ncbi:hypothetical protein HK099_005617 [Clydaea vesicula]|uniref:Uncharacterized protein n=1 Tax=Clydaea vesicula TaxID=447962 RepID=A0AAD5TZ12_9FUNG|nr:hypothetical protein HK099_005617 [Clydaea vesicula]
MTLILSKPSTTGLVVIADTRGSNPVTGEEIQSTSKLILISNGAIFGISGGVAYRKDGIFNITEDLASKLNSLQYFQLTERNIGRLLRIVTCALTSDVNRPGFVFCIWKNTKKYERIIFEVSTDGNLNVNINGSTSENQQHTAFGNTVVVNALASPLPNDSWSMLTNDEQMSMRTLRSSWHLQVDRGETVEYLKRCISLGNTISERLNFDWIGNNATTFWYDQTSGFIN